jgi:patatin-like phospholipase/acyl hydrolase
MSKLRILSIDGGGIKGVFPASFLASMEKELPEPLYRYFDLIAGTSTGGIIALGLGHGLNARDLLEFYLNKGPLIFPAHRRKVWRRWGADWVFPRYNASELRKALVEVFGNTKLGELKSRLLIPSLNAASGDIHIYKTPYHPRLQMDYKARVVDVALATSAAPTYLPAHVSPEGIPFLDGGLWANNPTGMAVVDAISMLGANREDIEVLSLGCSRVPQNFAKIGKRGRLSWAKSAIDAAMSGQSYASMGTAYQLVGHDHVERINVDVEPGRFDLDATTHLNELCGHGFEKARHALPKLRPRFFESVTVPFEPLYKVKPDAHC